MKRTYAGYYKEYYQKNKEASKERSRRWVAKNPEKAKRGSNERRNKWAKTPKGIYFILKNNSKYRSKKSYGFNLKRDDFIKWYEEKEKVCYYCGIKEGSKRLTIERKDNNKGYEIKNMELACDNCNKVKGNILTEEEMLVVGNLVMKKRWDKYKQLS